MYINIFFLIAGIWTTDCSNILEGGSGLFIFEFDTHRDATKRIFGCDRFAVNPVEFVCPVHECSGKQILKYKCVKVSSYAVLSSDTKHSPMATKN